MEKHKYAIETVYKGYRFRSRLEAKWAYFFDQIGVKYQYEVEGYELPGTRYLPDFLLTLRRYNNHQNVFVEIKPRYPLKEDQYKAQWLAHYTQTPVYIFFDQFRVPEPEEISAIRFSPIQIKLKLLSYTSSSNREVYNFNSVYLPQNIYLDLLQFYRIGCQLTIPTKIRGEGNGKKKAHESRPEEEVWEAEALLTVVQDLGRHLLLALESPRRAWTSSWDGTARRRWYLDRLLEAYLIA